jgi:hypothetical protein
MIMLSLSQKIYISFAILGGLIVIFLLWLLFYRNLYKKYCLKKAVGYTLYRYSNLNDFLLLNDYRVHIDDKHIGHIEHVLISNKFIIIINDFQISGVLSGEYNSEQLKLTTKKGEELIANPLNYNRNLTRRVALFNDLDNNFLKGIVVINDDSIIDITGIPNQFKICTKKELKKVIAEFDKEDVKPFKEETVIKFINILNDNNIPGK